MREEGVTMQAPDPVQIARDVFDAYRRRDAEAIVAIAAEDVSLVPAVFTPAEGRDGLRSSLAAADADAEIEITPHSFEALSDEHVLVGGRLRVFRQGMRDSPAWWLLTIRDGRWVAGATFGRESDARAAACA
jgi:ketosteroid isomerase-like protein